MTKFLAMNRGNRMDLTYISLEKRDRVAVAWMNKPKANTYDADLMRDLNTMIDDVRFDDDIDVCVLASKLDGIWSAGADINLLASSTPDYKAVLPELPGDPEQDGEHTEALHRRDRRPLRWRWPRDRDGDRPPRRLRWRLASRIAGGHPRCIAWNWRHAAPPPARREEPRHRPHGDGAHDHPERRPRLGPFQSRVPAGEVLGRDDGLRERARLSAALRPGGRAHQKVRDRRD